MKSPGRNLSEPCFENVRVSIVNNTVFPMQDYNEFINKCGPEMRDMFSPIVVGKLQQWQALDVDMRKDLLNKMKENKRYTENYKKAGKRLKQSYELLNQEIKDNSDAEIAMKQHMLVCGAKSTLDESDIETLHGFTKSHLKCKERIQKKKAKISETAKGLKEQKKAILEAGREINEELRDHNLSPATTSMKGMKKLRLIYQDAI